MTDRVVKRAGETAGEARVRRQREGTATCSQTVTQAWLQRAAEIRLEIAAVEGSVSD